MKLRKLILFTAAIFLLFTAIDGAAQKKAKRGKVCGDPTAACAKAQGFEPFELPFATGKDFLIYESEYFYGIVLKSKKLGDWGDCEHPSFAEPERLEVQEFFSKNKVFALNCTETDMNYYTGVAGQTAFIGVYAGRTLAEANKFLKKVQATGKFPGVKVRKMQIGINGT